MMKFALVGYTVFVAYDTVQTFKREQLRCERNITLIEKVTKRFPDQLKEWHDQELSKQIQFRKRTYLENFWKPYTPLVDYWKLEKVGMFIDYIDAVEDKLKELDETGQMTNSRA